jgi:hypothetical protein
VVIVGSILLAFAIEASWGEFRESRDEEIVLLGLRGDFQGYLSEMIESRASHDQRVEAADFLLASTGVTMPSRDEAALLGALSRMFVWDQVFLPAGTLGSLMESQGLALIGNPELRRELVEWRQSLGELDEGNDYMVQKVTDLEHYLAPRFPGRTLGWSRERGDASVFSSAVAPLLNDVEFENHIYTGRIASLNLLQNIADWETAGRRILDLIEAEL